MAKIPKRAEDIVPEFVKDYQEVFGRDLVSVLLYGSAARGEYVPGKSDINFMIVLSAEGIDNLGRAFEAVAKWKKSNVAVPLFVTEEYVKSSVDTFPIEYLNIREAHRLVHGKNILKDLDVAPPFLRLQCEREIKGKLLLLREAFLETQETGKLLKSLIRQSMAAFVAIFRGLLHLAGQEVPSQKRQVLDRVCKAYDMDRDLFETLLDIGEGKEKLSAKELSQRFKAYMKQIQALSIRVDQL